MAGQASRRSDRLVAAVSGRVTLDRGRLQRDGYSVAALRQLARRRLPRMVFDFCDGGAEDEITRARNETAFADWEFLPTPLNGTSSRDQSIALFGERLALPVIIGPTGLSGMLWPRGEVAAARAAADRRHGLHHEPRLDRLDRAPRQRSPGPAVVPELHVSRPRPHPVVRRAGAGRRLSGAGPDHRQPGAGPARARSGERLRDPAPGHLAQRARRRARAALGAAHGARAAHFRQLRERGAQGHPVARGVHREHARPDAELEGRRLAARHLAGAIAAQGRAASGRGAPRPSSTASTA